MNAFAKVNRDTIWFRWLWPFGQRAGLAIGVVVANLCYASFATAQNTLYHIDPVIFTALQMAIVLPVSLLCCAYCQRRLTRQLVCQGGIAGVLLGLGFIGVALSLRNLGIVRATMLTALDGVLASMIARYAFRQQQNTTTWLAVLCAAAGSFLLWFVSPGAWQADLLALLVGLLFCLYALYIERNGLPETVGLIWPFFGIVFATMAVITLVLALCFGNWTTMQFSHTDLAVLAYTSYVTVLVPIILNTILQRHISAVGLSLAAVVEPLAALGFAYQQRTLHLIAAGWIGIACIVLSLLIIAIGSLRGERKQESLL